MWRGDDLAQVWMSRSHWHEDLVGEVGERLWSSTEADSSMKIRLFYLQVPKIILNFHRYESRGPNRKTETQSCTFPDHPRNYQFAKRFRFSVVLNGSSTSLIRKDTKYMYSILFASNLSIDRGLYNWGTANTMIRPMTVIYRVLNTGV